MTLSHRPANTTLVLLASLYCAQGLPSGLVAHSLPVLLRQNGVDLALIGLLKLLALALVVLTLPILLFPEKRLLPQHIEQAEPAGPGLLWRHYQGLLAQPGMLAWLAVVLTFKLGDALGSPMIKPMLVDQGWDTSALGQLTLISSLAGIGGALLGGLLYARIGALRSLLTFGALQALGIAAMALLVGRGGAAVLVYAVSLFEQAADGMSTVALFAVMMRMCRPEHEGADFTLQASAQVLLAGLIGASSGFLAKLVGYEVVFIGAAILGGMMLILVARYFAGERRVV